VVRGLNTLAIDAHNNVTQHHLPFGILTYPTQARPVCGAAFFNSGNENPGEAQAAGVTNTYSQTGTRDLTLTDDLRDNPVDRIDRHREANPRTSSGRTIDGHIDPNETSGTIEEGPSGVPRIDRRIGLDHPGNRPASRGANFATKRTDNPH